MVTLNTVNRGMDDATLENIIRAVPEEQLDELLKSFGYEIQVIETDDVPPTYEPLHKADVFDMLKALKNNPTKVLKRILCHMKNGTTYWQTRPVNADTVKPDPVMNKNMLKVFDSHVSTRRQKTAQCTEHAADIKDMKSTPEGRAALKAINKAIGSHTKNGKLTDDLHYTNIRYCKDPTPVYDKEGNIINGCVAIAKNPKTGKDQYFYSQAFEEIAEKERCKRAMLLASPVAQEVVRDLLETDTIDQDVRDCINLMYNYGLKSGNEEGEDTNQLGDIRTNGATTLTAGNIFTKQATVQRNGEKVKVTKVFLQFYATGERGKSDHLQSIEIADEKLAARLIEKKAAAESDDERIFSCTKEDTLAVCKATMRCNNEDLRTAFGFRMAMDIRHAILGKDIRKPKKLTRTNKVTGEEERMTATRVVREMREFLKTQLGVTDDRSVDQFINKDFIKKYQFLEKLPSKTDDKKKKVNPKKKTTTKKKAEPKKKTTANKTATKKKAEPKPKGPTKTAIFNGWKMAAAEKGKGKSQALQSKYQYQMYTEAIKQYGADAVKAAFSAKAKRKYVEGMLMQSIAANGRKFNKADAAERAGRDEAQYVYDQLNTEFGGLIPDEALRELAGMDDTETAAGKAANQGQSSST